MEDAVAAEYAAQRRSIVMMNHLYGFDVVIICCSSGKQAHYWQRRLEDARGAVLPLSTMVLAVEEGSWNGGAGNALGTLFAFQNAARLAKERHGIDLQAQLNANAVSVAMYHTAGKGTRLAPLPGAENNNKPGVKLPATISVRGEEVPITILEAVLKQTGVYALCRKGRLSVFWGDQVFVPSSAVEYTPTHHADILCSLGPMPSADEWSAKGLEKYGLIAVNGAGNAAQVEKVSHATACKLLENLGQIDSVGTSLGSFSLSFKLLTALLNEFENELMARNGKMDADPHWWMPMTLDRDAYIQLMQQKGISEEDASAHHDRIQRMLESFAIGAGGRVRVGSSGSIGSLNASSTGSGDSGESVGEASTSPSAMGLFGAVDVGQNAFWWDYGQLKLYQKNNTMLTEASPEADLMRLFFNITNRIDHSTLIDTRIDDVSIVRASAVGQQAGKEVATQSRSRIRRSVLSNVHCQFIDAEGCILVNVTAKSIIARPGSIIYNVVDDSPDGLELDEGQIFAGVFNRDGSQMRIKSMTTIDGGKAWKNQLEWNPHTFEEVYHMNQDADPLHIEAKRAAAHSHSWRNMSENEAFRAQKAEEIQQGYRSGFTHGVIIGSISVVAILGTIGSLAFLRTLAAGGAGGRR